MYWNLLALLFFIPVIVLYVRARYKNDLKKIAILQPLETIIALACAVLGFLSPRANAIFSVLVTMGLIISVCADSVLIDIDQKNFIVTGTSFFSFVIAFYAAAIVLVSGFNKMTIYAGIIMIVIFIFIILFQWKGMKGKRVPVIIYSVLWCFLLTLIISAVACGARISKLRLLLFTAGTVLFFLSDCVTSLHAFVKPAPKHLIAVFYGTGQLLIALSLGY